MQFRPKQRLNKIGVSWCGACGRKAGVCAAILCMSSQRHLSSNSMTRILRQNWHPPQKVRSTHERNASEALERIILNPSYIVIDVGRPSSSDVSLRIAASCRGIGFAQ
jgi:hypothetical protein